MPLSQPLSPQVLASVQVATPASVVAKAECAYSFDTPRSPKGLYVSLSTFRGFGHDYVELDHRKTGNALYLHIQQTPKQQQQQPTKKTGDDDNNSSSNSNATPPEKRIKHLAIGVPGGFDAEEETVEYEETLRLVLLPSLESIPLPDPELPMIVTMSIDSIRKADASTKKADVAAWIGDRRAPSKFSATLQQLDNGVAIPPSGWKCSNCELTTNLWMNLTDGTVLCGRRNYDGSGGNNHAVEYYDRTKYPLAVKLGTINAEGADVFSYPEDDMVVDTCLKEHLKHFGIDMEAMQKTEKTIAEMELDQNLSFEFNRLQESGKELTPLFGPGFTGLQNLGNSCYLSSVVQVLYDIPEFKQRYFANYQETIAKSKGDPQEDVELQLSKLAFGIHSGNYSQPNDAKTQEGIAPRSFKALIGKGHVEFSTMRQQDAVEFLQHLLTVIERSNRAQNAPDPSAVLKFRAEEKLQCQQSGMVRYNTRVDNVLSLPIPLHRATNAQDVAAFEESFKRATPEEQKKMEKVRPIIPLMTCLEALASPAHVDGFLSPATGKAGPAETTFRLRSFPKYLVLQMRKFAVGENWAPIKLDVLIDAPEELDLEFLRGSGLQPGETVLPDEPSGDTPAPAAAAAAATSANEVQPEPSIVAQLMDMGFPENGCKRAALKTQNQGVEAAMNWVLEHTEDADFNAPLSSSAATPASGANVDAGSVAMLVSMGFTEAQAMKALNSTQQNLERAADWLFSHAAELDAMDVAVDSATSPSSANPTVEESLTDGAPHYRLRAFVSHMGTSTSSGHYVCHIRKEGWKEGESDSAWVLFNDSKVAVSTDVPKDLAYLYFYERMD